jgi:hypothetical protein
MADDGQRHGLVAFVRYVHERITALKRQYSALSPLFFSLTPVPP